ncbi:(Lyso)-N-acylphosphatidylethanolamine lipase-like [Onthophagus taurus]|uniref:(Lyso)-N-acylphosphatidylethanolamine lipase-like n=1 Tax=Onthophagus taurus TaxID=166361 RepID=UPI000C20AF3F|nr:protein ABHD4-like [Onthophagus taurus]
MSDISDNNKAIAEIDDRSPQQQQQVGWMSSQWLSWNKFSENLLRTAEKKILSYVKTPYRGWYTDIGPVVGHSDKIWTISMNTPNKNTPIVLLHGLGAGVAFWCLNLDSLAMERPVYAMDLLGFGRSSRPAFSKEAAEAETQMVDALEAWRREMNLDHFVLLGHSLGGFLAASYAICHPERVAHLILADPWGFPEKPAEKPNLPLWVRVLSYSFQPFNPLFAVRVAGPLGQWLINKARPDISKKFQHFVGDENLISQYVYQCNAQPPTGESAFHAMMAGFGWAKQPMINRIDKLSPKVPITLLYGSRSWVDNTAAEIVKEKRPDCFVQSFVIPGAGHHVYADKAEVFNKYVLEACRMADDGTCIDRNRLAIEFDSGELNNGDETAMNL